MPGDAPLLERLAGLPAVSVGELVELLERMEEPGRDPLLAGLAGADEDGEPAIHPLVAAVVEHLVEVARFMQSLQGRQYPALGQRQPLRA